MASQEVVMVVFRCKRSRQESNGGARLIESLGARRGLKQENKSHIDCIVRNICTEVLW